MEHPEVYGPDHPDGLARAMEAADRKRIEAYNAALLKAHTYLDLAKDDLLLARFDLSTRDFRRSTAIDELRRAAEILGYDLVKRDD